MRTWLEVDFAQLGKNLNTVRGVLPEGCEVIAVVKANAYGHGYETVSRKLRSHGVSMLAVACMDEALQVRKACPETGILVLGHTDERDVFAAADKNITISAVSPEHLLTLAKAAEQAEKPLKVHLAVNTGMNRIGFDCKTSEQLDAIAEAYRTYGFGEEQTEPESKNLVITGIFSHFSSADDTSCGADEYTKLQLDRFNKVLDYLAEQGINPGMRHISNSGGIGKYPDARFDAVRCGALIYGYNTAMDAKLSVKPIAAWKASVTVLRTIDEGDAVSYSRKFIAKGPRTIATLGIGYADGLSRALSNKGFVLINGMRAPIVGNICMDQLMVDVTEIQLQASAGRTNAVIPGTEAIIIGKSGGLTQTADDIAEWQGSCMHEVLSTIAERVERYYRE